MKKVIEGIKGFLKGVFDTTDSGKVTGCCGAGAYLVEIEKKTAAEKKAKAERAS
jgi:hypothetical protein